MDYEIVRDKCVTDLTLYCRAKPLSRPRRAHHGGIYQPLDNQLEMQDCLDMYDARSIDFPIIIDITCDYIVKSKSLPDHIVPYDVDNVMKAVLDNLQRARMIKDDKLVLGASIIKRKSKEDRVHVRIYKAIHRSKGLSGKSNSSTA